MLQITEIKTYIAEGNIHEALSKMQCVSDRDLEYDILKIFNAYEQHRKKVISGIISNDEASLETSRITHRIVELLYTLEIKQTVETPHEDYEAGRKKLLNESDYIVAIECFSKVPPLHHNYLSAQHNICLAKFALAETEADIIAVFKMLNDLEDLIINAPVFNHHLLERLLLNRAMMARQVNIPELAEQDFEKLNLMCSPLGTPYQ